MGDPDEGDLVDRDKVIGKLELRSLEFRYKTRPENLVLKGVDLTMEPGTVTALVGKSEAARALSCICSCGSTSRQRALCSSTV